MQRDVEEEKEKGRWLLNSSSPCWDAQAEQGAAHSDVGALLPGRRPVPVLALYHRKLFLLLKLGRSRNIWWNSPTGHVCDKWIKLDKVMLTAIGLCMSQIQTRQHRCFIHFLKTILLSHGFAECHLFIWCLSKNINSLKNSANTFHKKQQQFDHQQHVPFFSRNLIYKSE